MSLCLKPGKLKFCAYSEYRIGHIWMCSCDLVGYNLPREVLNTSSWKEIMNVRSGTDILNVCNVCARTTVTIESYQ